MLIVREAEPDVFVELQTQPSIIGPDEVQYPWQIVELWSDSELEALGIFRVTPVPTPEGKTLISYTITRVNGIVSYVGTFEDIPEPPRPEAVVTPRQIRLALNAIGMRDAVETYVNGADQNTKDTWLYATQFERSHPMIAAAAAATGKTSADLDALFLLASTL